MQQDASTGGPRPPLSRRDFVRALTAASAAGPGLIASALAGCTLTPSQRSEAAEAMVQGLGKLPKRDLGARLGHMKITPICISSDWNSDLFAPALALGINFVHKAHRWSTLPEPFRNLPRDSYYTDITVDSTPNHPDDEEYAYRQVSSTLERNGLKYYDIFRAHFGWRSVDAFKNQTGTYRAFQRLKKEGKVHYFGVSQHASPWDGDNWPTYPAIIQAEIDSGLIDSMQVWYGYGYPKQVEEVFARASQAGIAMTAMKVFAQGSGKMSDDHGRMTQLKADGMVGRACIRNAMTLPRPDGKPIFATCVSALGNDQQFEENIGGLSPQVARFNGFEGAHILEA